MKRGGGLFVATARRVHERVAKRDQRRGLQLAIAGSAGIGDSAAQTLQPRIQRPGTNRRLTDGEQRPGLVAAWPGHRFTITHDARLAKQVDRERHVVHRAPGSTQRNQAQAAAGTTAVLGSITAA